MTSRWTASCVYHHGVAALAPHLWSVIPLYHPRRGGTHLLLGNLCVSRSSEAFGTGFLVGFSSAVFGFGLPVKV